jgi:hypothetical protein
VRRLLGPKRDEAKGAWRELHCDKLHNLYPSPNINTAIKSRSIRWAMHVASTGEKRNAYKVSVRKHEGKRPLERSKHRWEDNIKTYFLRTGLICLTIVTLL